MNYGKFKNLRNQAQDMIRLAKRNYYLGVFHEFKEPNSIQKNSKHHAKSSSSVQKSCDELNEFFSRSVTIMDFPGSENAYYLDEEIYDDNKRGIVGCDKDAVATQI